MSKLLKEKSLPRRGQQGKAYPESVRMAALRDYLGGMSRSSVALKYSITDGSVISRWKRKFASAELLNSSTKMSRRRNKRLLVTDMESDQAHRIKELERALSIANAELRKRDAALKQAELRADIAETTIDIAEEEFNIDIRKKFGTR